jgi:hypothetical protein
MISSGDLIKCPSRLVAQLGVALIVINRLVAPLG